MVDIPKGIQYWLDDGGIDPNAPQWAKDEYDEYERLSSYEPDENGMTTCV